VSGENRGGGAMKAFVGVSGSLVIMVLIVGIQYSMISDSIRNREVKRGMDSAFDYCLDCASGDEETFMREFCSVLYECMITDGELDVYLVCDQWDEGYIDIIVEETYDYKFFGKKGKNRWEQAYKVTEE
jgi:hypothetical protein